MSYTFTARRAERAVLGGIMLSPDTVFADVAPTGLVAQHFCESHNAALYALLCDRLDPSTPEGSPQVYPVDAYALVSWLSTQSDAVIQRYGGLDYVSGLPDEAAGVFNGAYYAGQIIRAAGLRRVRDLGVQLVDRATSGVAEPDELVTYAEQQVLTIGAQHNGDRWITAEKMAKDSRDRLEKRRFTREQGGIVGLPWGIAEIDAQMPTKRPGQFILIAGRPGSGKTSFAVEVARQHLLASRTVVVFEMEMEDHELADKLIALQSDVPTAFIRDGLFERKGDWHRAMAAIEDLGRWSIYLDHHAEQSMRAIRSKARRLSHRLERSGFPLGLVVLDYVQLIHAPGKDEQSRLGSVSRGCKSMAKELKVPVLALAQLNRDCESRSDRRPQMSDLRGSGQLEQDADIIGLLYREYVYNKEADPNAAEVDFVKWRGGETARLPLFWEPSTQRYGRPDEESSNVTHLHSQPGARREVANPYARSGDWRRS